MVNPGSQTVPGNLYQLLDVSPSADKATIKKAYLEKMKICHPDVAGDEGQEMCILLNDAYDMLSDPEGRAAYDEQVLAEGSVNELAMYDPDDTSPTWKSIPKHSFRSKKPQYLGRPFSRSRWNKVEEWGRGPKWEAQKFVYVDEYACITCRNCCDVAPHTFCIDVDAGRARAFAQWGDYEEDLDYAVMACPVECIYWVSRKELQVLEFLIREDLYEKGNQLPVPMGQNGAMGFGMGDPTGIAAEFEASRRNKRKKALPSKAGGTADTVRKRIEEVFTSLTSVLREAGWGAR